MENNKGQSIFLSVVGIATLLVAIVGATFAYFSIQVTGNETASSIQITTATVGNVVFLDGKNIDVENIYPGWEETKDFTIAAVLPDGVTATADGYTPITYQIFLNKVSNTLSAAANNQFVYSLTGSETGDGGATGTLVTATGDVVITDGTGTQTIGDVASQTGIITASHTHSYVLTVKFKENNTSQNAAQGKAFAGVLSVEVTGGTQFTWDNTINEASVYTPTP